MRRGEIYFVKLDPIVGHEQAGYRPVLVMSIDDINLRDLVVTVVPGTSGSNIYEDPPYNVRLSSGATGLPEETVFLCFQIRAIDKSRFTTPPAGQVDHEGMQSVKRALRYLLKI